MRVTLLSPLVEPAQARDERPSRGRADGRLSPPRLRQPLSGLARMGASLDDIGFALSKTW